MKTFLKNIIKKTVLTEVKPTPEVEKVYQQLGGVLPFADRTLRHGMKMMRMNCLDMASAPGVTETLVQILGRYPKQASLLDYGCWVHKSEYLKKLGFKVHSCDIVPFEMENFTLIDPKELTLPFSDKQFDIILASELLEHVESPWQLMNEFCRIGKTVIITTPNVTSMYSRKVFSESGYLQWFEPKDFEYHISPIFHWQMSDYCKRHGVSLKNIFGNHTILGLGDHGKPLEYAESLIYIIES